MVMNVGFGVRLGFKSWLGSSDCMTLGIGDYSFLQKMGHKTSLQGVKSTVRAEL